MDVEIPVLAGVLTIPTQTGFSLNRISKKVRQLCQSYSELLSRKKNAKDSQPPSLIKSVRPKSITLSLL